MNINLRHLRLFLAVAETASISDAANRCFISQPAATQAIAKIENEVGIKLLTRTKNGTFTTKAGEIFATRIKRALDFLDPALNEISKRLKITVTTAQLKALIAVSEAGNFTLAARRLALAQPTVHRAVSELENEAGEPMFLRSVHGIIAKKSTLNLAHKARLAFAELHQAAAELAELRGAEVGQIVIGALPLSRAQLLPKTLIEFRKTRPTINVQVIDGRYQELLQSLRQGQIDMMLGALRIPSPINDIEQHKLFDDDLVIVAARTHPLAQMDNINFSDLHRFPWIVALKGTPTRDHYEQFFRQHHAESAICLVETASFILMQHLLENSHHLGFISRLQALTETKNGKLCVIPFPVENSIRPIGLTVRKDWHPTPTQQIFLKLLREQATLMTDNTN